MDPIKLTITLKTLGELTEVDIDPDETHGSTHAKPIKPTQEGYKKVRYRRKEHEWDSV